MTEEILSRKKLNVEIVKYKKEVTEMVFEFDISEFMPEGYNICITDHVWGTNKIKVKLKKKSKG